MDEGPGNHCILSSLAMANGSGTEVAMPTRKPRRKRNRNLGKRNAGGDSKEDSCEEMDPNKYAASIVQREELEEILGKVTQGKLQQYAIFITNLCAISRFCLERAPGLQPHVKDYVEKHIECGPALLSFILEGPHPSLIPQENIPLKGSATEPNSAKQQQVAPSSGTSIGERQSVVVACLDDAEEQSTHPDHFPQVLQTGPTALTGAVQHPALAESVHQQTDQQALREHTLNRPLFPTQGTAEPTDTSSAAQLVKLSQYASNAIQGNSNTTQLFPTPSTIQPVPQDSHSAVNPGTQPVMVQPFQMHTVQQTPATAFNFASGQSQTPATHPVPMQVHASQPTGPGWAVSGHPQVPPTMQFQIGTAASNSSAPPTTFPHGPLRAVNPAGSTQMSSQAIAPVQQGNATQPWSQVYGQSGPLHMFTQPSVAQSQAGTAPNSLWLGPSQEEHMPEVFSDFPSVFQ